jgi:hypothetical protein
MDTHVMHAALRLYWLGLTTRGAGDAVTTLESEGLGFTRRISMSPGRNVRTFCRGYRQTRSADACELLRTAVARSCTNSLC